MNNVVPFQAAVRGNSGRSLAYPTGNTPYATKCQEAAVRALLTRLQHIHDSTCVCTLIPEVYRCHPLERRLKLALDALDRGVSIEEAVEAAGKFGFLGSVEVRQ